VRYIVRSAEKSGQIPKVSGKSEYSVSKINLGELANQAQNLGVEANRKLEKQGKKMYDFEKNQKEIYYQIKKGDDRAKRVNRNMFYTLFYEPIRGFIDRVVR